MKGKTQITVKILVRAIIALAFNSVSLNPLTIAAKFHISASNYVLQCSQMRQQVLGEHHPKTKESLDLFASLYAEAGKQQYIGIYSHFLFSSSP